MPRTIGRLTSAFTSLPTIKDGWKGLRTRSGRAMFKANEVNGGGVRTRKLSDRLRDLCIHMVDIEVGTANDGYRAPRIRQKQFVPINHKTIRCDEGAPPSTANAAPTLGTALSSKLKSQLNSDASGMGIACGEANCPACRLPDADQPKERYIFFSDYIMWWNRARGRCMRCSVPLAFTQSKPHLLGNGEVRMTKGRHLPTGPKKCVFTLQRRDQRLHHFGSNISEVVCFSCNCSAKSGGPSSQNVHCTN